MKVKGIILAAGSGHRLYPITAAYSKQLSIVYDKPLIYYPLNTLISAGITDILLISTFDMLPLYRKLFANSHLIGLNMSYAVQESPNGIAEAFIIGADFIGDDNVCLVLGDNIFYGANLPSSSKIRRNTIFGLYVKMPERYGVISFNSDNSIAEIVEKPQKYISNYVVPGIYYYDNSVVDIARYLVPSRRNELEITDINNILLRSNNIDVVLLDKGVSWFDCGDAKSLLEAANFIHFIEERHGIKIGCYESELYNSGLISKEQLTKYIDALPNSHYKYYLINTQNKSNIIQGNVALF
ncbi:MAG: sugar phosphate nucleotidyltransferase [Bacteroidetes bacterium]|nr:sugar phosphate nucleotidyltransferase [Bacteroidota bacterium]